jgi:hypothetical protein
MRRHGDGAQAEAGEALPGEQAWAARWSSCFFAAAWGLGL